MPIPDIRLNNLRIRDVIIPDVPRWMSSDPPVALPVMPPVTMQLGTPIVNIPGCVQAHKDNKENVNLKEADDKGIMTLCDAGTPYYTALDYDRNKIKLGSISILLWCSFVMYIYLVLQALDINLTTQQYIGLTIISSIVTSLPVAPAAIGTYHLAVIYCLSLYGIKIDLAQTAAILMHSVFLVYTIIFGYIFLSFEKIDLKTLINDDKN